MSNGLGNGVNAPGEDIENYDSSLDSSASQPDIQSNLEVPQQRSSFSLANINQQQAPMEQMDAWGGAVDLAEQQQNLPDIPEVGTPGIDYDMGHVETIGRSVMAGFGDMFNSMGDMVDFLSFTPSSIVSKHVLGIDTNKPISDAFHNFGDYLDSYGDTVPGLKDMSEITWDDMSDPKFWETGVARMLPFALSLMIPSTLAAKGAQAAMGSMNFLKSSAAIAKGASSVGIRLSQAAATGLIKKGIATIAAGSTANMLEGAALAGGAMNQAIEEGVDPRLAHAVGRRVFVDNLASMGADIVQYGLFTGQAKIGSAIMKTVPGAAKTAGLKAMKAAGIGPVVKQAFKAIGMGAANGITDGVVEQFQEVYQDWSVNKNIAEAKGEDFPTYMEFFMADEQRPTRIMSFATSLLMSGGSNFMQTATENKRKQNTTNQENADVHDLIGVFSDKVDQERTYKVNKKVFKGLDKNGVAITEDEVIEISGEDMQNEIQDSAARKLAMQAVTNGQKDLVMEALAMELEDGNITQDRYDSYVSTIAEVESQMSKYPDGSFNRMEKANLVTAVWAKTSVDRSLKIGEDAKNAEIEKINLNNILSEENKKSQIDALNESYNEGAKSKQAAADIMKDTVNSIYEFSKKRVAAEKFNKTDRPKLNKLAEKVNNNEELTKEENEYVASNKDFSGHIKKESSRLRRSEANSKAPKGFAYSETLEDGTLIYEEAVAKGEPGKVFKFKADKTTEIINNDLGDALNNIDKDIKDGDVVGDAVGDKADTKDSNDKDTDKVDDKDKVDGDANDKADDKVDDKDPTPDKPKVNATPRAAEVAEEEGVDLSKVVGTGTGGKIRVGDVRAYKLKNPNGQSKLFMRLDSAKVMAGLARDAAKRIAGDTASDLFDIATKYLNNRELRRSHTLDSNSHMVLSDYYRRKVVDGVVSMGFMPEIFTAAGVRAAGMASGLGIFLNTELYNEEAVFHENFHIFRMLYGHRPEVMEMMKNIIDQPIYEEIKLKYSNLLLVQSSGDALNLTLALKHASRLNKGVITNIRDFVAKNGGSMESEQTMKDFLAYAMEQVEAIGYKALESKDQTGIQDEALTHLAGKYGALNPDLFFSDKKKADTHKETFGKWLGFIKENSTIEESEALFEEATEGLYKKTNDFSFFEKFSKVKEIIENNQADYSGLSKNSPSQSKYMTAERKAINDSIRVSLDSKLNVAYEMAVAFHDEILGEAKKSSEDLGTKELIKAVKERRIFQDQTQEAFISFARAVLSEIAKDPAHGKNSEKYDKTFKILNANKHGIMNTIKTMFLSGLNVQEQKALKGEESAASEDVESEDGAFAAVIDGGSLRLSSKFGGIIKNFLTSGRAVNGELGATKNNVLKQIIMDINSVSNPEEMQALVEARIGLLKGNPDSLTFNEAIAAEFYTYLDETQDIVPGESIKSAYHELSGFKIDKPFVFVVGGSKDLLSNTDRNYQKRALDFIKFDKTDLIGITGGKPLSLSAIRAQVAKKIHVLKRFENADVSQFSVVDAFNKRIEFSAALYGLMSKENVTKSDVAAFIKRHILPEGTGVDVSLNEIEALMIFDEVSGQSLSIGAYFSQERISEMFYDSLSLRTSRNKDNKVEFGYEAAQDIIIGEVINPMKKITGDLDKSVVRELIKRWKASHDSTESVRGSISVYKTSHENKGSIIEGVAGSMDNMQGVNDIFKAVVTSYIVSSQQNPAGQVRMPEGDQVSVLVKKSALDYNVESLEKLKKDDLPRFKKLYGTNRYALKMAEGNWKLNYNILAGFDGENSIDSKNMTGTQVMYSDLRMILSALETGSDSYKQNIGDHSDKTRRYYADVDALGASISFNEFLGKTDHNDVTVESLEEYVKDYAPGLYKELEAIKSKQVAEMKSLINKHNDGVDNFDLHLVMSPSVIKSLRDSGKDIKTTDNEGAVEEGEGELDLAGDEVLKGSFSVESMMEGAERTHEKLGSNMADVVVAGLNYAVNKYYLQDLTGVVSQDASFTMKNKRATLLIAPQVSAFPEHRMDVIMFNDVKLLTLDGLSTIKTIDGTVVEVTADLLDSASYVTQDMADEITNAYGNTVDVTGSFKFVGAGQNTDNAAISSSFGSERSKFYFKGHTVVLDESSIGTPLEGVYKALLARERLFKSKGIKAKVIAYADSGVKKGHIKGINSKSLAEWDAMKDDDVAINEFQDSWSYDLKKDTYGYDGKYFGVQNELDKNATSATVAKQAVSATNIFADHENTELAAMSQDFLSLYAQALDQQYQEGSGGKTIEESGLESASSGSTFPTMTRAMNELATSLPFVTDSLSKTATAKVKKDAHRLRTTGSLSLQISDALYGYEFDGDNVIETDKSLKPIRIENGKVLPAEVAISSHMASMLGVTEKELEGGKEVFFFATRIPASSVGSTILLKVARISPTQGNTIAINAKMSAIMGADLDGDMLHLNAWTKKPKAGSVDAIKNKMLDKLKQMHEHPEVFKTLIKELEFKTVTKATNLALYGNEKGSTAVYNDFNVFDTAEMYEQTKGNAPMIGLIASTSNQFNYLAQGSPSVNYGGLPLVLVKGREEKSERYDRLDSKLSEDGGGTYYAYANYLNLILDDGKYGNRAKFGFNKGSGASFGLMIKMGIHPKDIALLMTKGKLGELLSMDKLQDYAREQLGVEKSLAGHIKTNFLSKGIDIEAIIKGDLESAIALAVVLKSISNDMYSLGSYVGLDSNLPESLVEVKERIRAGKKALANQPEIAQNAFTNNPLILSKVKFLSDYAVKLASEDVTISNGYSDTVGEYMLPVDENDFDSVQFTDAAKLLKALNLSRVAAEMPISIRDMLFESAVSGVSKTANNVESKNFLSILNKLDNQDSYSGVTQLIANYIKNNEDFDNNLFIQHLSMRNSTRFFTGGTDIIQDSSVVEFGMDREMLFELQEVEQIEALGKDFEKLPSWLKDWFIANDFIVSGWGSNEKQSLLPYMDSASISKVNGYFKSAFSNGKDFIEQTNEKTSNGAGVLSINELIGVDSSSGHEEASFSLAKLVYAALHGAKGLNAHEQTHENVNSFSTSSQMENDTTLVFDEQFRELGMLSVVSKLSDQHSENSRDDVKYLAIYGNGIDMTQGLRVTLSKDAYLNEKLPSGVSIDSFDDEGRAKWDEKYSNYLRSLDIVNEKLDHLNEANIEDHDYTMNRSASDKRFDYVSNLFANIQNELSYETVGLTKEHLDELATTPLRRYVEYNYGLHISNKQIKDWELDQGKSFVEEITIKGLNKDISTLDLWMSPGDYGKNKPTMAYINKEMKMEHMDFTRNLHLVTKEMNKRLDALYKSKATETGFLGTKAGRIFNQYFAVGNRKVSEILYENLFVSEHATRRKVDTKTNKVTYTDASSLRLNPLFFKSASIVGDQSVIDSDSQAFKDLSVAEQEYLKMYVKYTSFYRNLIHAKGLLKGGSDRGTSYIPASTSSKFETMSRRGLFGLYYQMHRGDETLYDVVIEAVNPLTGDLEKLDYFSWKALYMHSPEDALFTTDSDNLRVDLGHGNTLSGAQRIKAFRDITAKAKKLMTKGKDDGGNTVSISSPINDVLGNEEFVNRFTSHRSSKAGYLATHNLHQSLRSYIQTFMFQHGNAYLDVKANKIKKLSWNIDDNKDEFGVESMTLQDATKNKFIFKGFDSKNLMVDAAMSQLRLSGSENALKYMDKVVKGGLINKQRGLSFSESKNEASIIKFFTNWTMYIALGFNFPAAVGNVLIGKYNTYRAQGGAGVITGEKRYLGIGSNGMFDKSIMKKSRLMIEEFGILTYRAEEIAEGTSGSAIDALIFSPMVLAENWIQQAAFLGSLTQEQWDSYEVHEGELMFKGDIKKEDGTLKYPDAKRESQLSKIEIAKLERDVINLQGRGYSETDQRFIQIYALSNSFMQFKRWFPTFLADRFKSEHIDDLGTMRIGSVKAASDFISEMRANDIPVTEWREHLKDKPKHLKDGVSRLWRGTKGIAMLSMILLAISHNRDDDAPEDETLKLMEKLLGDMLLVFNVPKLTYMANIPALSTADNLAKTVYHLIAQTEYKRKSKYGDKGDKRFVSNFAQLLPSSSRFVLEENGKKSKKRSIR